jgi:hypothetical protein
MICLFHKWGYVNLKFKSKHIDYCTTDSYRRCTKCGKWQIKIANRWFDCNPPKEGEEI